MADERAETGSGRDVLLTGVTGFIGGELTMRFLERTDRHVYVLVRASSQQAAQRRIEAALRCLFGDHRPYAGRVTAVCGDVTRPHLGLGGEFDALAENVSEIVHCAASVSFQLDLEPSREINVEGTRRMLELAQRCHAKGGLRRLSYVSTAYVAGDHQGCFSEDDLEVGQDFRNPYEQSKFEAESLLASWREQLPITVMRPSIVVGERASGWTNSFNVLYWPLRAFAHGAYRAVPAAEDACVDVVPVDYVADAVFLLSQAREAEGATFHLTAGRHASTVGRLVELASAFFKRPAPLLVDPSLYRSVVHPLLVRFSPNERLRRTLRRSEAFFPYFASKMTYDNRRCRAALCTSGVAPEPLDGYFDRLVEFALEAQWGRRPLSRAQAAAAARRASPSETAWPLLPTSCPAPGTPKRELALVR